jgi:putative DNA-invertase from lambdoid prophage Rac
MRRDGRALFGMLAVFAEFERSLIVDRVKAGLAHAREKGIKLGREPVSLRVREQVTLLRGQKMTQMEIARKIGISQAKVSQILNTQTSI